MRHHKLTTHRADARVRRPDVEALEERRLLATITVTGTGDTIANDGVVTLPRRSRRPTPTRAPRATPRRATRAWTRSPSTSRERACGRSTSRPLCQRSPKDSSDNTIGGTTPGARNIISGNGANGIALGQSPGPNLIQGNFIGVSAAGGPLGNTGHGVLLSVVSGVDGNTIGGTAAGAGNVIAFNGLDGVMSPGFPGFPFNTGNAILSNTIFANGGVGIDLALNFDGDGPTPDDPGDADSGPNNLQNFPVLTTVMSAGGSTIIAGTLDSAPGTYRVEFFANDDDDPSSFGEGQIFLGFSDVTIDAAKKDFTTTLPVAISPVQFVTATATDAAGNTSEFSQLAADLAITAAADLAVTVTDPEDVVNAGDDITYTITVVNDGPDAAANVKLTDVIPAHTTLVSFTAPAGFTVAAPSAGGTGTFTATAASLADGAEAAFTLVVRVAPHRPDESTIRDTATVTATTADPIPTDLSDTAPTAHSSICRVRISRGQTPSSTWPAIAVGIRRRRSSESGWNRFGSSDARSSCPGIRRTGSPSGSRGRCATRGSTTS